MSIRKINVNAVGGVAGFLLAMTLIIAITAVACGHDGVETNRTNNPDMHVTLLFEHNGCKVYRFEDAGEYIYYADCRGSSSTSWNQQEGKIRVPKQVQTDRENGAQ